MNALGHPTVDPNGASSRFDPADLADGTDASRGTFVSPVFVKPSTASRSYARNAYLDPIVARPNLAVLVGQQVTKVLFESAKGQTRAVGVTYANSSTAPTFAITATNEVILSAGVIGTPQLLELSGVGAASVLRAAGVPQLDQVLVAVARALDA